MCWVYMVRTYFNSAVVFMNTKNMKASVHYLILLVRDFIFECTIIRFLALELKLNDPLPV